MPSSSARPFDEGERAGRVVVHLQEALAPQRQQVGRADRLEAEEEGALPGQLGEVALAERFHPLAEGLLRAGREQDHPDPLGRLGEEALGQGQQGDDRGAVVVGAGDDLRRPMSAIAATEPRPRKRPSLASRRVPVRAPSAASTGPPTTGAISGGLVSVFSIRPRRSASIGHRRVEDEPGVGGVVVGDDDDGALGVGVAELADDVVGGAPGEDPAQASLCRAGSRRRCRRRRSRPGASRAAGGRAAPPTAPSAPSAAPMPERPPVGAVRGLGLDPRLGAELGEAARPATRRPGARRRRRTDARSAPVPRAAPAANALSVAIGPGRYPLTMGGCSAVARSRSSTSAGSRSPSTGPGSSSSSSSSSTWPTSSNDLLGERAATHAVPAGAAQRRRLLRLDPPARARPRGRGDAQRDRHHQHPALDLRRHGADGPRSRHARDRAEGGAGRPGGDGRRSSIVLAAVGIAAAGWQRLSGGGAARNRAPTSPA